MLQTDRVVSGVLNSDVTAVQATRRLLAFQFPLGPGPRQTKRTLSTPVVHTYASLLRAYHYVRILPRAADAAGAAA